MWKYKGEGFMIGIPARDITAEEFATFVLEDQETVKLCGLYEFVSDKKVKNQSPNETQEIK